MQARSLPPPCPVEEADARFIVPDYYGQALSSGQHRQAAGDAEAATGVRYWVSDMKKYYTVVPQLCGREPREWEKNLPVVRPKYPNYWLPHGEAALWNSGHVRGAIAYRRRNSLPAMPQS